MRQIIKIEKIDTIEKVSIFFKQMNTYFGLNWSPDENFKSYQLSEPEKIFLNKQLDDSFAVCEKKKIDIYELGMEINLPLREKFGIGTDVIIN